MPPLKCDAISKNRWELQLRHIHVDMISRKPHLFDGWCGANCGTPNCVFRVEYTFHFVQCKCVAKKAHIGDGITRATPGPGSRPPELGVSEMTMLIPEY